jgi:hypothetical protein
MMTITEMMTIGIQGTRAVRRGTASRRGHTMARHKDQRRCSTVGDGRSAIAIAHFSVIPSEAARRAAQSRDLVLPLR